MAFYRSKQKGRKCTRMPNGLYSCKRKGTSKRRRRSRRRRR